MITKMFWEQEEWNLEFKENGFTPLGLIKQLDKSGREALLEILFINYRDESESFVKKLKKFQKINFSKEIKNEMD